MIKTLGKNNFILSLLLFFCTIILLVFVFQSSSGLTSGNQGNFLSSPETVNHNKIYFNSLPYPDQILVSNPVNIIINFKTRLVTGSEILLLKDGKKVNFSPTVLDTDQTGLRQSVDSSLPNGVYTIIYKTCTSSNVCDNGNFNFYINRKISETYPSFISNKETAVSINQNTVYPKDFRISSGSAVVWVNHNPSVVIVQSDPIPQNNYFLTLNSAPISQSKSYRAIFNQPGDYPYHIDLGNNSFVTGNIVVQ